jgi:hypothetical protein
MGVNGKLATALVLSAALISLYIVGPGMLGRSSDWSIYIVPVVIGTFAAMTTLTDLIFSRRRDRPPRPEITWPKEAARTWGNYAVLILRAARANGDISSRSHFERAPGTVAETIVRWLPGKASQQVFGQIIADMRQEYIEAVASGNRRRQRIVWMRGHLHLVLAFVPYVCSVAIKRALEIWKLVP